MTPDFDNILALLEDLETSASNAHTAIQRAQREADEQLGIAIEKLHEAREILRGPLAIEDIGDEIDQLAESLNDELIEAEA